MGSLGPWEAPRPQPPPACTHPWGVMWRMPPLMLVHLLKTHPSEEDRGSGCPLTIALFPPPGEF